MSTRPHLEMVMTVSGLNRYVALSLQDDPVLHNVRLRGEVSNFKIYPSGHWYFTLKDEHSRIKCVIFRSNAQRITFEPQEGDQVVIYGDVRLYEEGGSYQFLGSAMRPEGTGNLYQQFERLKAKLQSEGLFDESRKRPLPLRPRKIAIVTSEAGAVLHDIRRVSARRDPGVPLVLLPVQVQGEGAAAQIASAIRRAGQLEDVDVMIIGRGGGSIEDLWAFNEEIVARAIADSPVPVISAVGHETDYNIADFLAERRASTPANAPEMAVPDRRQRLENLRQMHRRLDATAQRCLDCANLLLSRLDRRLREKSPEKQLDEARQRAQLLRTRLDRACEKGMEARFHRLPMAQIRLDSAMEQHMALIRERVGHSRARLEALSPQRVLERGYALVMAGNRVIADSAHAPQRMTLHFHDGTVDVRREEEETDDKSEKADL